MYLNFTSKIPETCFTVKITPLPKCSLNVVLRGALYFRKYKISGDWWKVLIE